MIFRNWVLQNFPFLEDDFDAITDYELFCKMVEYMKKSLDKIVEYQDEINEFRTELDTYKNYFDNLDVQEEINNKLDEMAESGELTDIIAQYLGLAGVLAYDTLEDLKEAENIVNGSICKILGRNSYNDQLGCFYRIRTILNTDVIDNDNIISITNNPTLVGEKIKDGNIKYFYINSNDTFDTIQNYLNVNAPKEIIFEKGDYTFTSTFRVNKDTKINLNNANLIFNIPKWSADWENSHGFFNFKADDEFLGYDGNGNIEIYNGTITHGNISFCHAYNIKVKNITFNECNNDHAIEICAINNMLIDNCIFNGCWTDGENIEKECIQFDEATYSNFPFFDSEDNDSYDNTYPKNITIKNCEFKNSETEGYVMNNCIGNDSYIDDSYVENVIIENNYFNNSLNLTMQLYNVKDIIIKNNKFYCNNADALTNEGTHIRLRNQFENVIIEDNIFTSNYRAIQTAIPDNTKNGLYIRNNIFKDYTNAQSNISLITLLNTNNTHIENNKFNNFIISCIRADRSENASSNKYIIDSNLFTSTLSITDKLVKIYDGLSYIINNSFDISSTTQAVIEFDNNCNTSYLKSNTYSEYLYTGAKMINFNGYNKNKKNIENVQLGWWGESASISNQALNNNLAFSDYKQLVLTLGYGSGTYIFYLQGFTMPTQQYLDARTFKFSIGSNILTFTINNDGTFSFNGQGNALRNVQLIN